MKFLSNILVKAGLVVEGSAQFNSLAGAGNRMLIVNASGVMSTQAITTGTVTGSAATSQMAFWTGVNSIGGNANFVWDNAQSRLGIGIATPLYTADVAGSARINGTAIIGSSALSQAAAESSLHIGRPLSAQTSYGATIRYEAQSGAVAAHGLNIQLSTQNAEYTTSNIYGVSVIATVRGASNIITNQYGFFVNSTFTAAANNYAYYSDIPAAAGRWNVYMAGSANNYFAGRTLIGSNIDDLSNILQVVGTSYFEGAVTTQGTTTDSTGYSLYVKNTNNNLLRVRNDGLIFIGTGNDSFAPSISGITTNTHRGVRLEFRGTNSFTPAPAFHIKRVEPYVYNSGVGEYVTIESDYHPVSGTGTYASLVVRNSVNQAAGTVGIIRSVYINPTVTTARDYRTIEWSTNATAIAGDSSWGLYGSGTANNYFGGSLGIGNTVLDGITLRASKSIVNAGGSGIAILSDGSIGNVGSGVVQYFRSVVNVSPSIDISNVLHYVAAGGSLGAGASIGIQYGFSVASTLNGATTNYGFYGDIASGTGRWNLYMNGTAANYINGNLLLGNTTDTTERLQVTGTMKVTGASTFSSTVTAASFIRSGGTASQFLKADGSVDSSTYLSSLTGEATNVGSSVTLTNSAVIGKVLTGFNATTGAVTSSDSILTAFGKVQGQINALQGGTVYKGSWNAATNTPTITSSVGVNGNYYVVTTAGTTTINGISSWAVGDWIIFNGTVWEKIPNIDSVVSVNGQTGAVSLSTTNISEGTNLYYTDARARAAISLTTTGSSGSATYSAGVLNVPTYTLIGLGGVPTSRVLTINGTSLDLAANRSWDIPAVTSVSVTVPTGLSVSGSPITTSGTIDISLQAGYSIPTTSSQNNWNTAYNNSIVSADVTGSATKTLTITQQGGQTIVASWSDLNTDAVTSVFGRTGAIVSQTGDYTTAQVTESTNLYYTDTRARSAISVSGSGSYNSSTGVITINGGVTSVNGLAGDVTLTTTNISEGTNLYYTDARARASISLTTTGSSGAATYSGGVLNIPNYTITGLNGVPTSRVLTINGTALDLSANRSFSVGTITGSGTANYVPKLSTSSNIANSIIYDNGTSVIVNSNTLVGGYSHSFQVLANAAGGMVISTTNSASAIGIINSSASNKTWDISPNNNDLAINESGVANGTRMYFAVGGNVLIGSIVDDLTNKLQVNGTIKSNGITVNGAVYASAYYESSDITRKNVISVNPKVSLDIDVVKFTRIGDTDIRYGYSAQQIRDIAPDLVSNGELLNVKYIDVHTLKIAALENEVRELKNKLNAVG